METFAKLFERFLVLFFPRRAWPISDHAASPGKAYPGIPGMGGKLRPQPAVNPPDLRTFLRNGLFRLTADKVAYIFGVRVIKRLRGKLHSVLEKLDHGHHVMRIYCKNLVGRMYEKFSTFLGVEVCVNRMKHLGLRPSYFPAQNSINLRMKFELGDRRHDRCVGGGGICLKCREIGPGNRGI